MCVCMNKRKLIQIVHLYMATLESRACMRASDDYDDEKVIEKNAPTRCRGHACVRSCTKKLG